MNVSMITQAWHTALVLKQDHPVLVSGFDLVSREDTGHTLLYFAEALLDFVAAQNASGGKGHL